MFLRTVSASRTQLTSSAVYEAQAPARAAEADQRMLKTRLLRPCNVPVPDAPELVHQKVLIAQSAAEQNNARPLGSKGKPFAKWVKRVPGRMRAPSHGSRRTASQPGDKLREHVKKADSNEPICFRDSLR